MMSSANSVHHPTQAPRHRQVSLPLREPNPGLLPRASRSESAISSMHFNNNDRIDTKPILIARTLDESLGKAGSEANESIRRRKTLRRLSLEKSAGASARVARSSSLPTISNNARILKEEDSDPIRRHTVFFNDICIKSFPITIGDNPSVSNGPAITIDWVHMEEEHVSVEKFEDLRRPARRTKMAEMLISSNTRTSILLNNGHTINEINKGLRNVNIAKSKRNRTIEMLHTSHLEEKKEAIILAVTSRFTSKKKEERRCWKDRFKQNVCMGRRRRDDRID